MSIVSPTVTAYTVEEYHDQIETVRGFATRIHIDFGDGQFTKKMIDVSDAWWPENVTADIHLMYQKPLEVLSALITLKPNLVIVHAEAEGVTEALELLRENYIHAGIAVLQETTVESIADQVCMSDHVLIFSGSLGSFGGKVDYSLLSKVNQVRSFKPDLEIGWDGGINADTVRQLADGGVDVLNVGGAIQKANRPENAYRDLMRRLYD